MRIEYVKTFVDPGGNEHIAGTKDDVSQSTLEAYLEWKVAKRVVYKTFVEQMNDDPNRKPPVDPALVEWGTFNRPSGVVQIFRKQVASGEMTFFKTPPADCPPELARKFLAMATTDNLETYEQWKERTDLEQFEQGKKERAGMRLAGLGKYLMGDWTKP